MSDVAVVIGSYQSAADLPPCLESVGAQTLPAAEVIVVDAGSTDGSAEIARSLGARVIVTENRGLGHLYNTGTRAARSPLVLLANADVALHESCLAELGRALDEDPARWTADPRQLDWAGERVIHARTVLRRGSYRDPIPGLRIDPLVPSDRVVRALAANAGAMLVRSERLLALGGFDESFFIDFEDLDVCWRGWLRGWESVYVPTAIVRHRVGGSTDAVVRRWRVVAAQHNVVRFALKCLPRADAARVVLGVALRLGSHPVTTGRALLRVALELREILRERRRLDAHPAVLRWFLEGQQGEAPR